MKEEERGKVESGMVIADEFYMNAVVTGWKIEKHVSDSGEKFRITR